MKKLKLITILILIFLLSFIVGSVVKYYLDVWTAERNVSGYLRLLSGEIVDDGYGGVTPKETFDLYVSALERGDLELASKYYVTNRNQVILDILRKKDIDSYIKELKSIDKNSWKEILNNDFIDIEYNAYRYKEEEVQAVNEYGSIIMKKLPIGSYNSTMSFVKINNIWKIQLL